MRYAAPTSVDEARTLLVDNPGSRVFAGATDLIPQFRAGSPQPAVMVDLKRIERLISVSHHGEGWTIGAATPTSALTANTEFTAMFPGLSEASGLIGSDQIQNRASWGGNLGNASPAADSVPALVAGDAQAVIATGDGTRIVPVSEIVTGPGQTSLAEDEFIIEFTLADPPANTSDAYLRIIPRTEMDIAIVGVAARLTIQGETITAASILLGAVAPTVVRVADAEAALVAGRLENGSISDDTLVSVADAASSACNPINDRRGTIEYRRQVAGVLTKRAVAVAADRARNGAV